MLVLEFSIPMTIFGGLLAIWPVVGEAVFPEFTPLYTWMDGFGMACFVTGISGYLLNKIGFFPMTCAVSRPELVAGQSQRVVRVCDESYAVPILENAKIAVDLFEALPANDWEEAEDVED